MIVNIHQAKTQLSRLIERVNAGEDIIIGRYGQPVARLIPYRQEPSRRVPGRLAGRIRMSADFDVTPAEIMDAFEGDR